MSADMPRLVALIVGLAAFMLGGLYHVMSRVSEPSAKPKHESLLVATVSPPANAAAPSPDGGRCGAQFVAGASGARAPIRVQFSRVAAPTGKGSVYFDPSVPHAAVDELLDELTRMDALMKARLGLSSSAPDVFLYKNAEQLRQGVCVSPRTVSYYDGAIHLALDANDDLSSSLRHEYTHHALFSHGIRRPVWFQEGVAMMIGGELQWFAWHPKRPLLPMQSMVRAFPQTADAESAEAFYGQAFAMTAFLNQLCKRRKHCSLRDFVTALENGVEPERLFDWAVSERGADLVRTARLPLWDDYVANGLQLSRATAQALEERR